MCTSTKKTEELRASHVGELERVKQAHLEKSKQDNSDTATLLSTHEAEVAKLKQTHESESAHLASLHEEAVASAVKTLDEEIERLTRERAEEKRAMIMDHDLFIAQLNASHVSEKGERERACLQSLKLGEKPRTCRCCQLRRRF